jgi:hypothetical protein
MIKVKTVTEAKKRLEALGITLVPLGSAPNRNGGFSIQDRSNVGYGYRFRFASTVERAVEIGESMSRDASFIRRSGE